MNEWEKYVLKLNRIPEEDVESVTGDMLVTFKDGTQKRICEVWDRVMGYYRPTTDFNVGKIEEHNARRSFTEVQTLKRMEEDDDGPDAA